MKNKSGESRYLTDEEMANIVIGSQEPYSDKIHLKVLEAFAEQFDAPATVLNAGCGMDISTTTAFPEADICYVDEAKFNIDALKKAGINKAIECDLAEFEPDEPFDLVVAFQYFFADHLIPLVKPGGYILCDRLHGIEHELHKHEEFELVAAIPTPESQFEDGFKCVVEDVEKYFTPRARNAIHLLLTQPKAFRQAAMDRNVGGGIGGLLSLQWRNLVQKYQTFLKDAEHNPLFVNVDGKAYEPLAPQKKAHYFVFQKKLQS